MEMGNGHGKWACSAFSTVILNLFQDPQIGGHDEKNIHRVPFDAFCADRHETGRRETSALAARGFLFFGLTEESRTNVALTYFAVLDSIGY